MSSFHSLLLFLSYPSRVSKGSPLLVHAYLLAVIITIVLVTIIFVLKHFFKVVVL